MIDSNCTHIAPTSPTQVEDDRAAKWEAGRLEHGEVMVADPLAELYQESLDGINYSELLQGDPALEDCKELLVAIGSQMRRCAWVVLYLQRTHPTRTWNPSPAVFK